MADTSITSTTAAASNPAITSKEVIEAREANLGFQAWTSHRYKDEARVGVSIAWSPISFPNSGAARQKTEGNSNAITYDVSTETAVTLTINQHWYSAFNLEEFENSLTILDLEQHYSKAAAYVVNLAIDDALAALVDNASNFVGSLTADLTDQDIRDADQLLNDANAPESDRYFGMSPATKNTMLGIERYSSSDFNRGGMANIAKGSFGETYGMTCWQSTNIEGSNSVGHDNVIGHRDGIALALRMAPKVHKFDDIDVLGLKVAISCIFGVVETRDDHLVWVKGL